MGDNRGLVYLGPGKVEVQNIADPKFEDPHGRKIEHAVILKVVSTNICGSDQHMVRGRTTAQAGLVLGHEITGEVIETGSDVELLAQRRHRLGAVQCRLRALPHLQIGRYRRLPARQ